MSYEVVLREERGEQLMETRLSLAVGRQEMMSFAIRDRHGVKYIRIIAEVEKATP